MTARLFNIDTVAANADLIFEAAKRLKAAKSRLGNKGDAEQEARDAVSRSQNEAHEATTAMVNGDDMRSHRDLADIQRELKAANTKLDKAIEKAHEDKVAMQEALDELTMFLEGNNVDSEAPTDEQKEAA